MSMIKNAPPSRPPRLWMRLRILLPFLVIPATVLCGALFVDSKHHAFVSLAVSLMSLLFFFSSFEQKKIGSRRMVLAAITIALSVAGRFIPLFKPVAALTVLSAVYLGGETGYLVGALSALISNIYFGQGPWTPFQMLAWGMIGLIAGLLSRPLKRSRALLISYGALAGVIFSMIMDVWTVLWYNGEFSAALYLSATVTALPHTLLYAISNIIFLALLARDYGERMERIKLKYRI